MATEIKAIETRYRGFRFRSRLEARWAVFFDALGIEFQYEPEGYVLSDGTPYLPDFWLPTLDCFLEVKGREATEEEENKAYLLSVGTDKEVYLFAGAGFTKPTMLCHAAHGMAIERYGTWGGRYDDREMPGYVGWYWTFWEECTGCARPDRAGFVGLHDGRHFARHQAECSGESGRAMSWSTWIRDAYDAALSARFEFGESGSGSRRARGGVDINFPVRVCDVCYARIPLELLSATAPTCPLCKAALD